VLIVVAHAMTEIEVANRANSNPCPYVGQGAAVIDEWILTSRTQGVHNQIQIYGMEWKCPESTLANWKRIDADIRLEWGFSDLICQVKPVSYSANPGWIPQWSNYQGLVKDYGRVLESSRLFFAFSVLRDTEIITRVTRANWQVDEPSLSSSGLNRLAHLAIHTAILDS